MSVGVQKSPTATSFSEGSTCAKPIEGWFQRTVQSAWGEGTKVGSCLMAEALQEMERTVHRSNFQQPILIAAADLEQLSCEGKGRLERPITFVSDRQYEGYTAWVTPSRRELSTLRV